MKQIWITHKPIILYGTAFAIGAFAIQWLENPYVLNLIPVEIYVVTLAVVFTFLGLWIGSRLWKRPQVRPENRNVQAIRALGLTTKELEVLELLALGGTNQEIADKLFISISTVKSHLIHIYQKLEVSRRTQAVSKSRSLKIIP